MATKCDGFPRKKEVVKGRAKSEEVVNGSEGSEEDSDSDWLEKSLGINENETSNTTLPFHLKITVVRGKS